ncbi:MAG TPA: succinylglutamate desuccinylase/aspartoacylase family protein [Gaiellaceae bacterium]|nr:succinylglutamate desuccinylase/aspartoacylase family protein [Gaiellaceae bacterium]
MTETLETNRVPVATIANGHALELVTHRIRGGRRDGPRLGLIAGIHGDEPLGVETIRRFVAELDTASFSGELFVLPVANPYAFGALTRNTTLDMSNLNRIFPGDENGMLTDQLAHAIVEQIVPNCDYMIDFHSGGNLATVDYVYLHDDRGLAEAFGCEILFRGPSYAGSLGDYARSKGIPTIVSELGGGQQLNEHYVQKGLRGIRNVMKKLDMLEGEPEVPERQVIVDELIILRPHHGGLMLSEVEPSRLGEPVAQGTLLGRIVSPYTFEVLEEVTAPFDPSLLVLVRERVTKADPGDYGFMVANGGTAVAVER